MIDFTDRTALVTGGGSGIGAAVCERLAGLGAIVYVSDMRPDAAAAVAERINAGGGAAHDVALDVTVPEECQSAVDAIVAERGSLDVLVTCAGWVEVHPLLDESPQYWRRVTDINFLGTVNACAAALGHMTEAGRGRIVTISSEAGRIGTPGEAVYAGAKAGVIAFTKSLAREGARHGVLANSVSPGVTDTPLMQGQDATVMKKIRNVPLRRLAQPAEIANAVAFMASDAASFVTGEVLSVSGGLSMAG